MEALFGFFESCGSIIVSVVEWFGSMLDCIIWVVSTIPSFIAAMNLYGNFLPSFVVPFFSISLSIFAVFAVLKLL